MHGNPPLELDELALLELDELALLELDELALLELDELALLELDELALLELDELALFELDASPELDVSGFVEVPPSAPPAPLESKVTASPPQQISTLQTTTKCMELSLPTSISSRFFRRTLLLICDQLTVSFQVRH